MARSTSWCVRSGNVSSPLLLCEWNTKRTCWTGKLSTATQLSQWSNWTGRHAGWHLLLKIQLDNVVTFKFSMRRHLIWLTSAPCISSLLAVFGWVRFMPATRGKHNADITKGGWELWSYFKPFVDLSSRNYLMFSTLYRAKKENKCNLKYLYILIWQFELIASIY